MGLKNSSYPEFIVLKYVPVTRCLYSLSDDTVSIITFVFSLFSVQKSLSMQKRVQSIEYCVEAIVFLQGIFQTSREFSVGVKDRRSRLRILLSHPSRECSQVLETLKETRPLTQVGLPSTNMHLKMRLQISNQIDL